MPKRSGHHSALRDFLQSEASGGIILIAAAAAAMIVANSPLRVMALSKQRGSHFPIWFPAQFGQPVPRFVLV